MAAGWTENFSAMQLLTDDLDLSVIVNGDWPWYVEFEGQNMGAICGQLTWTLTFQDGSAQDLITFVTGDVMRFAPQMTHTPGDYFFTLKATLSPTQVG